MSEYLLGISNATHVVAYHVTNVTMPNTTIYLTIILRIKDEIMFDDSIHSLPLKPRSNLSTTSKIIGFTYQHWAHFALMITTYIVPSMLRACIKLQLQLLFLIKRMNFESNCSVNQALFGWWLFTYKVLVPEGFAILLIQYLGIKHYIIIWVNVNVREFEALKMILNSSNWWIMDLLLFLAFFGGST